MKKFLLTLIAASFLGCVNAQVYDTAYVTTAGTLDSVAKSYLNTVTNLTVIGTIDVRDFVTMRDSMKMLSVIDLSATTIEYYAGCIGYMCPNYPNAIPINIFNSDSNLTSFVFPKSLTYIGEDAFNNCQNLRDTLNLPSSITYIGAQAFNNCYNLKGSFNLPSSITYIADDAFSFCKGLTGSLTIPSSVTYIGQNAFAFCYGLSTIISLNLTPLRNVAYSSFGGDTIKNLYVPYGSVNDYKAVTPWNSFNIVANYSFVPISANHSKIQSGSLVTFTADTSCMNSTTTLQWQVNGKNTGTGKGIFRYFPLNGDTIICIATINDTSTMSNIIVMNITPLIANVTVPGTLDTVVKNYLSTVTNLTVTGVIDARDFKTLRDSMPMLSVLNLSNVKIIAYTGIHGTQDANNDTYSAYAVPQYAFWNPQTLSGKIKLSSITLPSSINIIGESAFQGCGLQGSLSIPSIINYLGNSAFEGCSGLTSIITFNPKPLNR